MGLRDNAEAQADVVRFVVATRAHYVFLAVGSPQSELLSLQLASTSGAMGVGLCIGASIAFLTGELRRAPRWMQRLGLEWAHRLLSEPGRLWRRYLIDSPRIFALAAREQRERRTRSR